MLLIATVGRVGERELLVKAAFDLIDPLFAPAGNRSAFLVALCLKRPSAFAQPRSSAFRAGHEPLWVKFEIHPGDDLLAGCLLGFALGL